MTAIREYRVALYHVQWRRIAAAEGQRSVAYQSGVAEAEFRDVVDRVAEAGFKQQQAHGDEVH